MEMESSTQSLTGVLITGVLATALLFGVLALIIAPFEYKAMTGWVGFFFLAATPVQVILGLLWHSKLPDPVGKMAQPMKGLCLVGITTVYAVIALFLLNAIPGGGYGPTPMLIQYAIMTVIVVLWLVPVCECWPFSRLSSNPVVVGLLTLAASYLIAYLLWWTFFDYAALAQTGASYYKPDIDPGGLFDSWVSQTFGVTFVAMIVLHFPFDFWPIEKLCAGRRQPIRAIVATVYLLALTYVVRWLFVDVVGMEQVLYMVQIPVSIIFGTFLVNNMMQFRLYTQLRQPLRGMVLTLIAVVATYLVYELYVQASFWHSGTLSQGPQGGWAQELWIATAMLGISFPLIFVISGFFEFWPIKRK